MEVEAGFGQRRTRDERTRGHRSASPGGWSTADRATAERQTWTHLGADTPDLAKLAQDWITLWQSELSAIAADPEIHEILADRCVTAVGRNDGVACCAALSAWFRRFRG